nr:hypothetical protein CFP56_62513 [Quercus suber]
MVCKRLLATRSNKGTRRHGQEASTASDSRPSSEQDTAEGIESPSSPAIHLTQSKIQSRSALGVLGYTLATPLPHNFCPVGYARQGCNLRVVVGDRVIVHRMFGECRSRWSRNWGVGNVVRIGPIACMGGPKTCMGSFPTHDRTGENVVCT